MKRLPKKIVGPLLMIPFLFVTLAILPGIAPAGSPSIDPQAR
jgi:hypothetical protein